VLEYAADATRRREHRTTTREISMLNLRTSAVALAMLPVVLLAPTARAEGNSEKAKYYFKITNIQAQDKTVIPLASELLKAEVSSRPEFTMDIGTDESEDAQIAEIRRQGMQGYQVSMRIESFKKEIKPPAPGKRDPQMAVSVKLTVFGHTIPGQKLLFTGDGDASLVADFSERLKAKEEERFTRTALASAIKQAVSTAVAKLTNATLADGPPKAKKGQGKKKR
jgi:hypothetical protein